MKSVPPLANGVRNRILGRLSPDDFQRLRPHLQRLEMWPEQPLYEANAALEHVYFPETGVGSILTVLGDGTQTEVVTVGWEGIVGLPLFHGVNAVPSRAFWQVAGSAYRCGAGAFRQEARRGGGLAEGLHRYAQALAHQLAQLATCNRRHLIQERCSCWLLFAHDCIEGDQFRLTHESLARILGVRRPGVTVAAGRLQQAGLINYARGRLTVLDRAGLEASACECYGSVRGQYERLLS